MLNGNCVVKDSEITDIVLQCTRHGLTVNYVWRGREVAEFHILKYSRYLFSHRDKLIKEQLGFRFVSS